MENLRRWPLRGFRRGYGSYGDLPCPLSHISPVAAVAEGSRRTISRHDADTEVATTTIMSGCRKARRSKMEN